MSALILALGSAAGDQVALGQNDAAQGAKATYIPMMTFDVASVGQMPRVDSYTVTGWIDPHASALRLQNFSMSNLLNAAYSVDTYQIVGLPDWPYPTMFTIVAKSDHAADEKLAKLNDKQAMLEKQHMLQAVLADRFKLTVHWETRQGPVYNLVVAKPGRLQDSKSAPPSAEDLKFWGDSPVPALYQRNDGEGYDFIAHGASMAELIETLSGQLGRPVIDKTSLKGKYDFVLKYYGRTKQDRQADDMDPMLPIDEAIEAELGLKVVSARGAVEVLVVDHVDKPTAN